MSVLFEEMLLGCRRSLAVQLIAILIVVPLICTLICLPLWLVARWDASIWILIITAGFFLLILIGGGIGGMGLTFRRRARQLDSVFCPLGLTGSLYHLYFRQYHGHVQDREVSVYFYRGPTLEIEVKTSLQTRLAVTGRGGDASFFSRLLGREPLTITDERLQDLMAYALDAEWAQNALTDGSVPELLHRLINDDDNFIRRHVVLQPGLLRLTLFGSRNLFSFELEPPEAEKWVYDLLALAQALEQITEPEVTAEETTAEEIAQSVKQSNPLTLWKITLLMVLGLVGCACGAGMLGFLWVLSQ